MLRVLLFAMLLTVSWPELFGQTISVLSISPSDPTATDEVLLHISGDRWWSNTFINEVTVNQIAYHFTVNLEFQTEGVGLPVLMPFDTMISLGVLPSGGYDATVNGISSGVSQSTQTISWSVSMATSTGEPQHVSVLDMSCAPNPFLNDARASAFPYHRTAEQLCACMTFWDRRPPQFSMTISALAGTASDMTGAHFRPADITSGLLPMARSLSGRLSSGIDCRYQEAFSIGSLGNEHLGAALNRFIKASFDRQLENTTRGLTQKQSADSMLIHKSPLRCSRISGTRPRSY